MKNQKLFTLLVLGIAALLTLLPWYSNFLGINMRTDNDLEHYTITFVYGLALILSLFMGSQTKIQTFFLNTTVALSIGGALLSILLIVLEMERNKFLRPNFWIYIMVGLGILTPFIVHKFRDKTA